MILFLPVFFFFWGTILRTRLATSYLVAYSAKQVTVFAACVVRILEKHGAKVPNCETCKFKRKKKKKAAKTESSVAGQCLRKPPP